MNLIDPERQLIPPHAKIAFKGIIYEIWQWEQEMFDGSRQVFERLRRPPSVSVIAISDQKIILQRQRQPHRADTFISLPGGRAEMGEDPLLAAKREFLEETGYESSDWELFSRKQLANSIDWTSFTFIARNAKKVTSPHLDSGEQIETFFVGFEDFLRLADEPLFRHRDLAEFLIRAKYEPSVRDSFFKLLFSEGMA